MIKTAHRGETELDRCAQQTVKQLLHNRIIFFARPRGHSESFLFLIYSLHHSKKIQQARGKALLWFRVQKKTFSFKHQLRKTRQWKNVQTCPEKRRVCITTRASVPVMATHPQPLPFIVDAAGTRLCGCSLEYDSAETGCCEGGSKIPPPPPLSSFCLWLLLMFPQSYLAPPAASSSPETNTETCRAN